MSDREKERAMLCAALARLREASQVMEDLLTNDAPPDALIVSLSQLSYASGVVEGGGSVYIPRHGHHLAP